MYVAGQELDPSKVAGDLLVDQERARLLLSSLGSAPLGEMDAQVVFAAEEALQINLVNGTDGDFEPFRFYRESVTSEGIPCTRPVPLREAFNIVSALEDSFSMRAVRKLVACQKAVRFAISP